MRLDGVLKEARLSRDENLLEKLWFCWNEGKLCGRFLEVDPKERGSKVRGAAVDCGFNR